MSRAGYRFLPDLPLVTLLRLESVANVVWSDARDGTLLSEKTVPASLLVYELRPSLRLKPDPAELHGEASGREQSDAGEVAETDVASRLDFLGAAMNIFGFQPAGVPMTVLSL